MSDIWKFHADGTGPKNKQTIFVFGSNMGGQHLGGAARAAVKDYGAIMGQAVGLQGRSYAIPTLDVDIQTKLSLRKIEGYVKRFISFARAHPDDKFWITRVGCVIAGYSDAQIAPMFLDAPINCNMPAPWKDHLLE